MLGWRGQRNTSKGRFQLRPCSGSFRHTTRASRAETPAWLLVKYQLLGPLVVLGRPHRKKTGCVLGTEAETCLQVEQIP